MSINWVFDIKMKDFIIRKFNSNVIIYRKLQYYFIFQKKD